MMTKRPLFLPTIIESKKRKVATVQRTHSPKRVTQRQESKRIAPCVLGIQRGAQIMKQGQVLAIPTETVYVLCTCVRLDKIGDGLCQCKSISLSHSTTSLISDTIKSHSIYYIKLKLVQALSSINPIPTVTILVHSVSNVESLLSLRSKQFAIDPSHPVAFHEGYQVSCQLAKKYWPGPVTLYQQVQPTTNLLPTTTFQKDLFVALQSPSHPLMARLLQDMEHVVLSTPATGQCKDDFCTTAHAAQEQYPTIHVLDGEIQRELFSVPTCTYRTPCEWSLWIHDTSRTIVMRGIITSDDTSTTVLQTLRHGSGKPPTSCRQQVIRAVLRKWTVVDQRTKE